MVHHRLVLDLQGVRAELRSLLGEVLQQVLVHVRLLAHHIRLHFPGHTHRGTVCHRHWQCPNAQPKFESYVSLEGSSGGWKEATK